MTSTRKLPLAIRTTLLLSLALPMACAAGDNGAQGQSADAAPASSPPAGAAPTAAPTGSSFTGNIVETMDAGTYTYVLLERDDAQVWAAGPKTAVELGTELTIDLAMEMNDFSSETLGRTFETIYFVTSLGGGGLAGHGTPSAPSDPHAGVPGMGADPHAGVPGMGNDPHAGLAQKTTADVSLDGIEPAEGGSRVEALWADRSGISGQEVVVRGRVVKYNGGILGRNWIHIQDGSGDSAAGTNDLTVTSSDVARVGDLVTVRGTVALDKDFGAGYSYALIVENASVEVE